MEVERVEEGKEDPSYSDASYIVAIFHIRNATLKTSTDSNSSLHAASIPLCTLPRLKTSSMLPYSLSSLDRPEVLYIDADDNKAIGVIRTR